MALIVGTDTYVTVAEFEEYALKRDITIVSANREVLLIKSMDYIEVQPYKSCKTDLSQPLQFPRILCVSSYECEYNNDEVPNNMKTAQIIAALLVDSGNDLQPIKGRATKSEKVDVLEVVYMDRASNSNTYTKLDDLLRPFVNSGGLKLERV